MEDVIGNHIMHHPCNILVLLGKHNTIEEIARQIQNTGLTNEEGANMGPIIWTPVYLFSSPTLKFVL